MTAYTRWVLTRAEAAGIRRLYFLARDAWPMYLAAKAFCEAGLYDLDCRYLKVSRYALRLPAYHLAGDACVDQIFLGGIDVTLRKIVRRAGLSDEEGLAFFREAGLSLTEDEVLSYPQIMKLKEQFRGSRAFQDLIRKRSEAALPAAIGYLRQEGLLDGEPFALVDSGWIGTIQQTLLQLLRTQDPSVSCKGFYFGLYELPPGVDKADYESFYFGPMNGTRRKICFSNCLFETVYSSPDGMTLSYKEEAGDGPVFRAVESPDKNPNAVTLTRRNGLLKAYAAAYIRCLGNEPQTEDESGPMCEALLNAFMGRPTRKEAAIYGAGLFCDDVLEGTLQEVAAKLSEEEIRQQRFISKAMLMTGLKKGVIHESAWIEGSIVNNGKNIRANLRHAALYKRFVYLRKSWKTIKTNISSSSGS